VRAVIVDLIRIDEVAAVIGHEMGTQGVRVFVPRDVFDTAQLSAAWGGGFHHRDGGGLHAVRSQRAPAALRKSSRVRPRPCPGYATVDVGTDFRTETYDCPKRPGIVFFTVRLPDFHDRLRA
jgi:hypothetical protein